MVGRAPGKRKPPSIGLQYNMLADDYLRVAAVAEAAGGRPTPAAKAGIPVDSIITAVNGEPVGRWLELAEKLRSHAGDTVQLTLTMPGGEQAERAFEVPRSLRTRV